MFRPARHALPSSSTVATQTLAASVTEKMYEVLGYALAIVNRSRSGIGQLPTGTRAANRALLVAYAQEMFRDEATRSAARLADQTSA